jgi:hypothetical protein
VTGRRKPASRSSSRVRVSCGDSAPPSIRATAVRKPLMPRAPRCAATTGAHVVGSEAGGVGERIETHQGCGQLAAPAQVECRACRRRHGNASDSAYFAVGQDLTVYDDAVGARHGSGEFGGFAGVDPLRSMQGRGRKACHRRIPPGPQPGCFGAGGSGQVLAGGQVDVAVDELGAAGESPSRVAPLRYGLSADERPGYVCHGPTTTPDDDVRGVDRYDTGVPGDEVTTGDNPPLLLPANVGYRHAFRRKPWR